MNIPYGLSEKVVQNYMIALHPSLFTKLKFWFFGRKIVESSGMYRVVWCVYKDQLFLIEMKHKYL